MPPIGFDLTINLPLIFAIGGALWLGQRRLTTMENKLDFTNKQIDEHTKREEARFDQIDKRLQSGNDAFKRLEVADARVEGRITALEGVKTK